MRQIGSILTLFLLVFLGISCEKAFTDLRSIPASDKVYDEVLEIIESQYVFKDKLKGNDWQTLKADIAKNRPFKNDLHLFFGIDKLIAFLKDGHTGLISPFDLSRNWDWFEDFPSYLDEAILRDTYFLKEGNKYLNERYWISGGLSHFVIQRGDKNHFGYIRYASFSESVDNMPLVFGLFKEYDAKGIILDLRNNGGGLILNAKKLLSFLISEQKVVYQRQNHISPGEYGELTKHEVKPDDFATQLPIVVLTNRSSYSATNLFAAMTKVHPNITLLGDKSGGGAGVPKNFLLSNGWLLRVSAYQLLDAEGKSIENGVLVDEPRDNEAAYERYKLQNKDYFIEEAIKLLE